MRPEANEGMNETFNERYNEPWKTEATFVVIQKSQGQETYQQTTAKYRVFFLVY